MFTSDHPIAVVKGGVTTRLDTLAYNVSTRRGVGAKMAPLRGSSAEVPGRSGSIWRPGRKRDENSIILSMWAQDTDVDGVTGADPYLVWRQNMDVLLALFDTSMEQIVIREYLTAMLPSDPLPSSGYRQATCEVRAAIDPEVLGRYFGEFVVECIINGTYWEDYQDTTFSSPTGAGAVATHSMTGFLGSTAPMEDLIFCVTGPVTNPRIIDVKTGHWVQFTGSVASGQQWAVDAAKWLSATGTGINFDPSAGSSVTQLTTSSGRFSPRLIGISAGPSVAPQIQLTGTGAAAGTQLRVQGRRKFH